MKTKNQIIIALLSLACITLFGNCKSDDDTSGEIKVAVNAACGGTISYEGTHTFAYRADFGGQLGNFLVGGYEAGEHRELGLFLPWPPVNGTYNLSSPGVTMYYDPNNTCDDCPADGVDQYGSVGIGQIVLNDVQLNNDDVIKVDLTFSNVIVTHWDSATSTIDTLCLDAGIIKFE